jgi:hypothetical protein
MFLSDADVLAQRQRYNELLRGSDHLRRIGRALPPRTSTHRLAGNVRYGVNRAVAEILRRVRLGGSPSFPARPCNVSCCGNAAG